MGRTLLGMGTLLDFSLLQNWWGGGGDVCKGDIVGKGLH